ncbi:extracellular solute-binding protein [Eubacteriales bacterium OttesenSCG-928-N13]|nr:extracellular solute-binding protein [Eubacteriales bacterium OttesenSCG-928-N13]
MKKTLICLALVVALLASQCCMVAFAEGEKPETLILVTDNGCLAQYEMVADKFYEKYGIDVEIIDVAYDNMHDKITTMVLGGTQIDLFSVDTIWPAEFLSAKIAQPVTQYFSQEELDALFPGYVEEFTINGELAGVPTLTNSKWLFYNKAYLEQAGYDHAPTTWDELAEMSKAVVDKGICKYGIAWSGLQAEGVVCEFGVLLDSFGGAWQDADGKWTFNSEEGKQALDFMVEGAKQGWADPASSTYSDRVVLDPFMAGDIAFVLCWSYAYGFCNDPDNSTIAGNVDIALVPGANGTKTGSVTGGGGLGVSYTTKYPEHAVEFLKLAVSYDIQKDALESYSNMPVLKSVLADEELLKANPEFAVMADEYNYSTKRPTVTAYSEWSAQFQSYLNQALAGTMSVDEALKAAEEWSAKF